MNAEYRRNLELAIISDLEKKFVLLSGPRQVGKTTLVKRIIQSKKGSYLLYDDADDRRVILKRGYVADGLVCLDEFHKYPRWKNHIKGIFDKYHENLHLILTGSARLDVYQRSGDSLFGRYYLHHLHPLTAGELNSAKLPPLIENVHQEHVPVASIPVLLKFGGFPEPFHAQSEKEHRRWSNARTQLLIKEEIREISQIQMLALVEQLMLLLPERIGSTFSYRSLSEDIQVSAVTIQKWMEMLRRLFFVFRILPYQKKISRSLRKQPKYYFYDWSQIPDPGSRFENFVASHLWKALQVWTDVGEANLALHFIRDRDQREVDFLITRDRQPWFLVEAKLAETRLSENLRFFAKKLNIPGLQLVLEKDVHKKEGQLTVISADRWLANLP